MFRDQINLSPENKLIVCSKMPVFVHQSSGFLIFYVKIKCFVCKKILFQLIFSLNSSTLSYKEIRFIFLAAYFDDEVVKVQYCPFYNHEFNKNYENSGNGNNKK